VNDNLRKLLIDNGFGAALDISIEDLLEPIAEEELLPEREVALCALRMDEAAPVFRAAVSKAAFGGRLTVPEENLFFRGLHLLGGARDTAAFPALLQLLRKNEEDIDLLLGDAVTISLTKIVIGMFDGNELALFDVIDNDEVDGFVRYTLFDAMAFLTWEGRIDAAKTHRFLERFYHQRKAAVGEVAWIGWHQAIALLGLRDLAPLVDSAYKEGLLDVREIDFADFHVLLSEAEKAPADIERFTEAGAGYVEDVLEELQFFEPETQETPDAASVGSDMNWSEPQTPATNPWRDVGRNDPCPCGSGKKAKKCCLAAA
jgi:hypothetical protein